MGVTSVAVEPPQSAESRHATHSVPHAHAAGLADSSDGSERFAVGGVEGTGPATAGYGRLDAFGGSTWTLASRRLLRALDYSELAVVGHGFGLARGSLPR